MNSKLDFLRAVKETPELVLCYSAGGHDLIWWMPRPDILLFASYLKCCFKEAKLITDEGN